MTGETIGEVLAFGVGVALSPLAIVTAVVLLVAPGGTRSAWGFLAAWLLSLTLLSTLVLLLADGAHASTDGAPATWVSVVKVIVAVLLAGFGARQWHSRDGDDDPAATPPGWMTKLDGVTAAGAAGLGVVFAVVKPKNLLLSIGAGLSIAQVGASAGAQALGIVAFVVLSTAGLAIPYGIHMLMPTSGRERLIRLRDWMVQENATIIAVLSLVIAAKLLGDALVSLAS